MENTFEILIVEDDETLAAGLCRALLSQGLKAEKLCVVDTGCKFA